MSLFNNIGQSIFVKIYSGLVFICFFVAFVFYGIYQGINDYRFNHYRESMAKGAFYLIASGVARQRDDFARQNWLEDASSLFDSNFSITKLYEENFTSEELKKLKNYQAIIRFNDNQIANIYQKIPSENNLVSVSLNKVTEQQVKAVGVFLLDDLAYYPEDEENRLRELQQYFDYEITSKKIVNLDLDVDQIARLRRKEIVLLLRDSANSKDSSISLVIPDREYDKVIIMGPVKLFNPAPLKIVISLIIISLLLISLGVYGLIYPLERKIKHIQTGVTKVRQGELDTKVKANGNDEIAHLATTFNSMTEHIKRLIDTQREMTRAVSHELRTPVARIRFAVDMLADTEERNERFAQQENIDNDIQELDTLIDEILTYAKLEEGSPELNLERINLKELVDQIVKETNALGKPLTIKAGDINPKLQVISDKRYLHRVLQNLAGNATRYADSTIIINAEINKNLAYIAVEDDGPGIPEKDRDKVFMPFARLDDSRTRASGGYGLGLSIVSRIAFWFDGRMKVDESPTLGGARFSMKWPAKPIDKMVDIPTDNNS